MRGRAYLRLDFDENSFEDKRLECAIDGLMLLEQGIVDEKV